MLKYDPNKITLGKILDLFFAIHDPTTPNRQGNDIGPQYRSIIFYNNDIQKLTVENYIKDLSIRRLYTGEIVTEVVPFKKFYPAEDYHQNYFQKNPNQPYCQFVVKPKVEKAKSFMKKLK